MRTFAAQVVGSRGVEGTMAAEKAAVTVGATEVETAGAGGSRGVCGNASKSRPKPKEIDDDKQHVFSIAF